MRLMSFSATIEQMRDGNKTVTRRLDAKGYWMRVLGPGVLVCAVEKGQGLKKGESIQRIGVIEITKVFREQLNQIAYYDLDLGDRIENAECIREGNVELESVHRVVPAHRAAARR